MICYIPNMLNKCGTTAIGSSNIILVVWYPL
uniref:Uncharacterized protein n=1 Tax=Lepeophtheirus salmonis TaxID=72036 RepID=A0A0K2VJF7_LEPSM